MEPKSIKNPFKIRSKFQSDFGVVLGTFLINFRSILRTLNPQKWCSCVGAVLFLRKSRFSDQMRFWIDFLVIVDGLGAILGSILGSKSNPKIDEKINQILDRFWKGFGSQFGYFLSQFWLQKSIRNQGRILMRF